jgi:DNA replication protein DnaC
MRQLERGEASALEVIDTLFAEELTLRENRRVKMALRMAKLSTIKTLAGFDFSFQPSLDRNRVLALAQLDFIDRNEGDPLPRPTRDRQEPPRHRPWRRGRKGRP